MCLGWWVLPGRCCGVLLLQLLIVQQLLLVSGAAPPAPYSAPRELADLAPFRPPASPGENRPLRHHNYYNLLHPKNGELDIIGDQDNNPPIPNYTVPPVPGGSPGASSETPRNPRSAIGNITWNFQHHHQVCYQLYNGNSQRFLQLLTNGDVASTGDPKDPSSKYQNKIR